MHCGSKIYKTWYWYNTSYGNMFWARVDAILPFFTNIQMSDFPQEKGQIDGTIAHAIERLWVYVAEYNGYTFSYCGK